MSQLNHILDTKPRTLTHLKQLHSQLIQHFLDRQNHNVSTLLTHCTRLHAPPSYALAIFNSSPNPNVFTLTSILKFYSHTHSHANGLQLFDKMRKTHDIPLDNYAYPVLIKLAGRDPIGMQLHARVVKTGFERDAYVQNAVIGMYWRNDNSRDARRVFDEIGFFDRTVVDWNSMVSGYWRSGNRDEALRLFKEMPERNVVSWTAMVTGFVGATDLREARRVFDEMPGDLRNVVSWNAMLSGYSKSGGFEECLRLFRGMIECGIRQDETTWVTVISACSGTGDGGLADRVVGMMEGLRVRVNCFVRTALVDMYAKCGRLRDARRVFDELGVHRNSVTWNAMISAYARVGDLGLARDLFDRMLERNTVSWNSMIAGYAQNGQSGLSVELFKEMIATESQPDEVTMVSVIAACGHLGAFELGKWLVSFIEENCIKLSMWGYNSLIFMYSKCGSMIDAEKVFREMETRDVVSYNALISGLAAYGRGKDAICVLSKMKQDGIEPDRLTYMGVLTACSHAGLLEDGRKVFSSIKVPSVDHYSCMVDLLGRVGRLDEAKNLIKSMPMEPHAGVYGSLLNASRIHKRVDLGELAATKLFELEPSNSGNYVLLSNIYASAGRWQDVDRIREAMKNMGVKKTTAWSWVEYKGKIHKFIIGDRAHERSDDIYVLLAELGKKMRRAGYMAEKTCVLRDIEDEEKEEMVGVHSEKLAICFALLVSEESAVIRLVKNLRVCRDCHTAIKLISKLERRTIIVRDNNRFHSFHDGICSCNDYW